MRWGNEPSWLRTLSKVRHPVWTALYLLVATGLIHWLWFRLVNHLGAGLPRGMALWLEVSIRVS